MEYNKVNTEQYYPKCFLTIFNIQIIQQTEFSSFLIVSIISGINSSWNPDPDSFTGRGGSDSSALGTDPQDCP